MNRVVLRNINGYLWKIIFVETSALEYDNTRLNDNDGYCDFNNFTIYIRNELCSEAKEKVLIHEITHAYLDTQGRVYQEEFNLLKEVLK